MRMLSSLLTLHILQIEVLKMGQLVCKNRCFFALMMMMMMHKSSETHVHLLFLSLWMHPCMPECLNRTKAKSKHKFCCHLHDQDHPCTLASWVKHHELPGPVWFRTICYLWSVLTVSAVLHWNISLNVFSQLAGQKLQMLGDRLISSEMFTQMSF